MHTYYLKYLTLYSHMIKNNVSEYIKHLHIIGYTFNMPSEDTNVFDTKNLQCPVISNFINKILQFIKKV
jgi:hypothetical protein